MWFSSSVKSIVCLWSSKRRGGGCAPPTASLTRVQSFNAGSLLTWAAGKNRSVNLAQVHKLSIQSASDGWIMDGRINEAWHEFYIPDPAGNEIKWVLNVTLTTVMAHKSLFCTNSHASRFHESQIKFTFYWFNNCRRSLGWIFCDCSVLPVFSLWWAPLSVRALSVHGSQLLPDMIPLRSHRRGRGKESLISEEICCHLSFISSSDTGKNTKVQNKALFWEELLEFTEDYCEPLTHFH